MISSCDTPIVNSTLAELADTVPRSLANPNVGLPKYVRILLFAADSKELVKWSYLPLVIDCSVVDILGISERLVARKLRPDYRILGNFPGQLQQLLASQVV